MSDVSVGQSDRKARWGADDARPRSAWYAFQRLSWLLSYAVSVDMVYNADGLVIVRFTGRSRGFPRSAESVFALPGQY